jgi:hypothetical protein
LDVTADADHFIVFDKLRVKMSPGRALSLSGIVHRFYHFNCFLWLAFCGLFSILFSFCYMMQCSSHKTNREKLSNDVNTNIKLKQWRKKKKKKNK